MKILLDTNVLIDYYLHKSGFYDDVSKIFMGAAYGDFDVWAPTKSFSDIYYVGQKFVDGVKLQKMFLASFKYMNTVSLDSDDLQKACLYGWEDFEDCLISLAAEKINAKYMITRDAIGFKESRIEVVSPRDFLEIVERDFGIRYAEVKF